MFAGFVMLFVDFVRFEMKELIVICKSDAYHLLILLHIRAPDIKIFLC